MKKLTYISLAILLLIGLTGCGLPKNVKTQELQALRFVQANVTLPAEYYSPLTGDLMEYNTIQVSFQNYDTNTGEAVFYFEVKEEDPNQKHFLWFCSNPHDYTDYYLALKLPPPSALLPPTVTATTQSNGAILEGYGSPSYSSIQNIPDYQQTFTLSQLQADKNNLIWWNGYYQ
jgi:hypothetical protein